MKESNSLSNLKSKLTKTKFWENLERAVILSIWLNFTSPIEAKTDDTVNNNLPNIEFVDSPVNTGWNVATNDEDASRFAEWLNLSNTGFWKNLWYPTMLATTLNISSPIGAETSTSINDNLPDIELVDSPIDIIWNVERRTWIKFPIEYRTKLQEFVDNNEVMRDENALKFTEEFIVNQLEADWWISKPNQSLFIRAAIYQEITKKFFYNWSDGDSNRLDEFQGAMDCWRKCMQEYREWFSAHMQKLYDEAYKRSTEMREKNRKWLNESLGQLKALYYSYKESPSDKLLQQMKNDAKELIPLCNKYGVDYKLILSPEICNFLGIK